MTYHNIYGLTSFKRIPKTIAPAKSSRTLSVASTVRFPTVVLHRLRLRTTECRNYATATMHGVPNDILLRMQDQNIPYMSLLRNRLNPTFVGRWFLTCTIAVCLSAINTLSLAAANDKIPAADFSKEQNGLSAAPTDITSDSMDFDLENRQAIFLGNVRVVDDELELKADKLIVQFDEGNKIQTIDATGNVAIYSGDNKAVGGKAIYRYEEGIVTLSEKPELIQGDNRLVGADEIIYKKDEKKFKTKGGPVRIIFYEGDENTSPFDSFNQKEKDSE